MAPVQTTAPKPLSGDGVSAYLDAMKLANWISYDCNVGRNVVSDKTGKTPAGNQDTPNSHARELR